MKVCKHLWLIGLFVVSLAVLGCSARGSKFSGVLNLQPEQGVIYVYRPSAFLLGGTYPNVYLNDAKIAPLKNGGFVELMSKPGKQSLMIKGNPLFWVQRPVTLEIDVLPGKPNFVRVWLGNEKMLFMPSGPVVTADVYVAVVDEAIALKEIAELRKSE